MRGRIFDGWACSNINIGSEELDASSNPFRHERMVSDRIDSRSLTATAYFRSSEKSNGKESRIVGMIGISIVVFSHELCQKPPPDFLQELNPCSSSNKSGRSYVFCCWSSSVDFGRCAKRLWGE